MSDTENRYAKVSADNPIRKPEEDVLGRVKVAHSFAEQVLALDITEGVVVGVLGPWGSGKTSFVNLARTTLKAAGAEILDFNPWMFSGAEQLVEAFFLEISAQLKIRPGLDEIGEGLEEYGESFSGMGWLPLVGPWIERGQAVTRSLGKILQRRKEGVGGRRAKMGEALRALKKPLVVVLDDIDRLTTSEIRDVFKLVRLTANFPNIVYVVAFDRTRVEDALAEQGIPGRDYLEKILQIGIDLPVVPERVMQSQIFQSINDAISGIENSGPYDENLWPDVFAEIIRPLLRNMRDVRRYAAAVHGTVRELEGRIALVDVLALEAIRVFLPDVFRQMQASVDGLTATGSGEHGESSHLKEQINRLVEVAGDRADIARALIQRLFPGGQRHIGGSRYGSGFMDGWLRERRVAHKDILRFYLERVIGEGLQAFTDAEQAWARMADQKEFDSYLRSLDPGRLEDVISSLEAYEKMFAPSHVVPGCIVLLNILPSIPERQRDMFDFGREVVVERVVHRLIRSLKKPEQIQAAVEKILPQLAFLSEKERMIRIIGHREHGGQKLVSEITARRFEAQWRAEVRSATPDSLAEETNLFWILLSTKRSADPVEPPIVVNDSPRMTLALLRSARWNSKSQTDGNRAVKQSPRLDWDGLIELFGDEETLKARIARLKTTMVGDLDETIELADKYLGGWRPNKFGED